MAGFLGTLFTGRVALNLALPNQAQWGRAQTLFGKGLEGVFACGDVARLGGSVSLAVGDGTMAGVAAHRSLLF